MNNFALIIWTALGLLLIGCSSGNKDFTKEQVARVIETCSEKRVKEVTAVFVDNRSAKANFVLSISENTEDRGEAAFALDTSGTWALTSFSTRGNYGSMAAGVDDVCGGKLPLQAK